MVVDGNCFFMVWNGEQWMMADKMPTNGRGPVKNGQSSCGSFSKTAGSILEILDQENFKATSLTKYLGLFFRTSPQLGVATKTA